MFALGQQMQTLQLMQGVNADLMIEISAIGSGMDVDHSGGIGNATLTPAN